MTHDEFLEKIKETFEERLAVMESRSAQYAPESDALGHFKEIAAFIGITPLQVWAVLTYKHFSAIMSQVRKAANGDVILPPGGEDSIFANWWDEMNYLDLGMGLLDEYARAHP